MNLNKNLKNLERRIRASLEYAEWVKRNKSAACFCCESETNLECHHIPELYVTLSALWKLYDDGDAVVEHAKAMHEKDQFSSVTLCKTCHKKKHPGQAAYAIAKGTIRTELWIAFPRNLSVPFTLSTVIRPKHALGLLAFQTLLGLGWYILNGHLDSRIVEFHSSRFASLLGKKPSSSFKRGLEEALKTLTRVGILTAYSHSDGMVEVHFSKDYLKALEENPWFISLDDIQTNNMSVLVLRWWLNFQNNRRVYTISLDKLKSHIGMTIQHPGMAQKTLLKACKGVGWATLSIKNGMCSFTLKNRGAMPVFSLRQILQDSLSKA